jgi:hypothetical protein
VEPVLRRFLIELLNDLHMALDPVTVAKSTGLVISPLFLPRRCSPSKCFCVGLLERLIAGCPTVVAPYTVVIMTALLETLGSADIAVSSHALAGVGAMAVVSGPALQPYLASCLTAIMATITDQVRAPPFFCSRNT